MSYFSDMDEYKVSSELYEETNTITDIQPVVCRSNVVSTFKFILPEKAVTDSDGDFDVRRKNSENSWTTIEIEHSTSTVLELVGLQVWRGAFLLADFVIYNNHKFPKEGVVLELGSGVGLTSIIASMYRRVICTDIDQGDILMLISENVKRNKALVKNPVSVLELDFLSENFTEQVEKQLPNVKVILAADVIYDDSITEAFVKTIGRLLRKCPTSIIYVALEKRYVFTMADCDTCAPCYDHFVRCLKKTPGISTEMVPLNFPRYFQYERVKELVLWKISI